MNKQQAKKAGLTTLDPEFRATGKIGSNKEAAEFVGELVGKRAVEKGVSKTVKGGRRMSLVALVAVGDGKGNVGLGMGKSAEVPLAIQNVIKAAAEGLKELSSPEQAAERRGMTVGEMFVGKEN